MACCLHPRRSEEAPIGLLFREEDENAMSARKLTRESNTAMPGAVKEKDGALIHIAEALRGLQFGHLTIVVQDGVVVQIERTEKRRLK